MKSQKFFQKRIPAFLKSKLKIRPYAAYLAQLSGHELIGAGGVRLNFSDYKLFPRRLPDSIKKGSEDPYFTPFKVDIISITSRVGFSYENAGWHPFVQTLKEYEENPDLNYEDSSLARLYNNYQPNNIQEVLIDHIQTPQKPFCDWPPVNDLIKWVWVLNENSVRIYLNRIKKTHDKDGWIFFGPHTPEYGKKEFQRLIGVYESIKANGYQSEITDMDPVNGYFLKKGKNTRFVLLQGNHRVSALKALGYSNVDVIIRRGHPAVIDWDDLYKWTQDCGGIYPSSLIKTLFDALFDGSGLQKAKRHDLLVKTRQNSKS
jgi:hypothetical protein